MITQKDTHFLAFCLSFSVGGELGVVLSVFLSHERYWWKSQERHGPHSELIVRWRWSGLATQRHSQESVCRVSED